MTDPRIAAIPDIHGHAKGEHRPFIEERPIAYSARMLFLWFYHACRRASPRFLMVADHANYLTFEDPGAVATVRRALKLAQAGDLLGAAETAGVDAAHASVVSDAVRRGMRFAIGAEMDNDPRARPDAQNIVDALRPDGIIRSVHFVPIAHPEKGSDWAWPFDSPEFAAFHDMIGADALWSLYTTKLFEDIEKLPTNIVGHFYVPATLGTWPATKSLEAYEDRLLDICHQRGLAIEVNTRFLYRDHPEERKKKYLDANARLIRKAKAKRVGIAIGSDAHSPKDQGNAFDLVLRLLDDARINEVVFPVAGRLARVALRATREHLEAQARAHRQPSAPGSSISGYSRAELGLPEEAQPVGARRRQGARLVRSTSPRKRGSESVRAPKRPGASPPAVSTSRRTADSTQSAKQAKDARLKKVASPSKTKKETARRPEPKSKKHGPAVKAAVLKPAQRKAAATGARRKVVPKKIAAKKAPAKQASVKTGKKASVKAGKKTSGKKAAAKKAAAKKSVGRRRAEPKRTAAAHTKNTSNKKKRPAKRR